MLLLVMQSEMAPPLVEEELFGTGLRLRPEESSPGTAVGLHGSPSNSGGSWLALVLPGGIIVSV